MSVNFNGNHLNSSSTNPFLNGACFEDENSFIRAISKINLTTLSQTDINTVIKIQTSLEKLKLRFPDKSDLIQTSIDNSISLSTKLGKCSRMSLILFFRTLLKKVLCFSHFDDFNVMSILIGIN